jgi:hypothetical protein
LGGAQQVSIYHQGQLLEVHARITDPYQSKSTKPEHLKPWERAMRDDSMYRKRAAALGPHVDEMVLRLLGRGQGFIDTRRIWGILSLDKRYAAAQINEACRRALELDQLSYRTVKGFWNWRPSPHWRDPERLVLAVRRRRLHPRRGRISTCGR